MSASPSASKITFLDCTLRDGGYYCDWDFSLEEAQDYIDNMAKGGVDIIEIGFRFTKNDSFLGPFAYAPEETLAQLDLPENVQFGVMINASDYLTDSWKEDLEASFVPEAESAVSLVRIAAHIGQVTKCRDIVTWFKDQGYDVGLNVMQISQADDATIEAIVREVEATFPAFEALYFADSLGNLTTEQVTHIVGLFRAHSDKPIGFHGHDNIGLGVRNSLAAIEAGATWVDATVTGMGRGAGNTQTEYLSLELSRRGLHDFNALDIQRSATGWLAEMKRRCEWGTNIFYYEAGLRSLHPSYVQQMLGSQKYAPIDIMMMIDALSNTETPTSYRAANIEKALAGLFSSDQGTANVDGLWAGRPVVLVAGGANGARHWDAVAAYARRNNAVVLAVNHVAHLNPAQLDGVVGIHPARLMQLVQDKAWTGVPLYTSLGALPESLRGHISAWGHVVDYGAQVTDGADLSAGPSGCTLPQPQALAYAWALAQAAGASELWLVGFDGYDGQSPAYRAAAALIEDLKAKATLPAIALTATHFPLPARGLYAPAG